MHHISIHALREEGDNTAAFSMTTMSQFLSTPSARRATAAVIPVDAHRLISIHALREEGDAALDHALAGAIQFLSTPSARRATGEPVILFLESEFLSTPSARRATDIDEINTHIHKLFLSTPSARRATLLPAPGCSSPGKFLSTPSARRATHYPEYRDIKPVNFYPRPPRGGRHAKGTKAQLIGLFLSTPSARRATNIETSFYQGTQISIHALREEGDSKNRDKISIFL